MRSLLFVSAHDTRKLTKGRHSYADALIIDLADAVPETQGARARSRCAEFVRKHHASMCLFVRVNALATGRLLADLDTVVRAQPHGICCQSAEKVAIHPNQIGPIKEAFIPSETDIAWAKRVIAAFVASPETRAIAIDGKMLDRPHYRSAQRMLARAATPNNL